MRFPLQSPSPTIGSPHSPASQFAAWLNAMRGWSVCGPEAAPELPYVDADRDFVARHSSGAAETMLAALLPSPFRAAASIGGYVHQGFFVTSPKYHETLPNDATEARLRSPIHFAATPRCPLYAFFGAEDVIAQDRLDEFVQAARAAGWDCRRIDLAGDHHTSKAAAIRESVKLFLAK